MVRTHSPETLEGALSHLMMSSDTFEWRFRENKTAYLEAFVHAAETIAKHEGLPSETIDPFIDCYVKLYEQDHASRVEFMEEWGYGAGVPLFKTSKDYTNLIVRLEEAALCSLAAGGLWYILVPFINPFAAVVGSVASVVFATGYLFHTCKEKLAEHHNQRVTDTPGYKQMIQFHEKLDQLIKDTVYEDTFA